jgi:hypothetical protein
MKVTIYKWTVLLGVLLMLAVVIGGGPTPALADVNVGDVIDSSNWQKVQGMLPEPMMEYLEKGWIKITVGKLNFDPADMLSTEYKESLKKNVGRYAVTPKGELLDQKTGEIDPSDLIGIPFPVLDLKDPQVAIKMLYNKTFYFTSRGGTSMTSTLYFIGQKMERYISILLIDMFSRGSARNIAQQASAQRFGKKIYWVAIAKLVYPYEFNGITSMTYSYSDNNPDKVFFYVPGSRRARVLAVGKRSDVMYGTDYALDDAGGGFSGKPSDFTCKYLRTQDTLERFNNPNVLDADGYADGSYNLTKSRPDTKWGFQTPEWKGKAWATTNDIWIVRKVHVIECLSKDPDYGYGKFELWYDPGHFNLVHKIIWNKAGKRWKVMNMGFGAYCSKDNALCKIDPAFSDWIYDEQRDHATGIDEANPKDKKQFYAPVSSDYFTQAGLIKFSK